MPESTNITEILSKKIASALLTDGFILQESIPMLEKLIEDGKAKDIDWINILTKKISTLKTPSDEVK